MCVYGPVTLSLLNLCIPTLAWFKGVAQRRLNPCRHTGMTFYSMLSLLTFLWFQLTAKGKQTCNSSSEHSLASVGPGTSCSVWVWWGTVVLLLLCLISEVCPLWSLWAFTHPMHFFMHIISHIKISFKLLTVYFHTECGYQALQTTASTNHKDFRSISHNITKYIYIWQIIFVSSVVRQTRCKF